ncbi:hypothetical protein R3P38DRAFT_2810503 [Favolaschia claudopus]|uniref:Uncharacterized protein n=1 Tax=Favolaschia claudopus TaxID=2862362 RepID=A0AAV9ZAY9_9AGAR
MCAQHPDILLNVQHGRRSRRYPPSFVSASTSASLEGETISLVSPPLSPALRPPRQGTHLPILLHSIFSHAPAAHAHCLLLFESSIRRLVDSVWAADRRHTTRFFCLEKRKSEIPLGGRACTLTPDVGEETNVGCRFYDAVRRGRSEDDGLGSGSRAELTRQDGLAAQPRVKAHRRAGRYNPALSRTLTDGSGWGEYRPSICTWRWMRDSARQCEDLRKRKEGSDIAGVIMRNVGNGGGDEAGGGGRQNISGRRRVAEAVKNGNSDENEGEWKRRRRDKQNMGQNDSGMEGARRCASVAYDRAYDSGR